MNVLQEWLDTPEDDFLYDIVLNEVGTSNIKRNKMTKRRAVAGMESMKLARDKRDPAYAKYMMFRKRALLMKQRIQKKYKSKGMMKARKVMR